MKTIYAYFIKEVLGFMLRTYELSEFTCFAVDECVLLFEMFAKIVVGIEQTGVEWFCLVS